MHNLNAHCNSKNGKYSINAQWKSKYTKYYTNILICALDNR